MLMAVSISLLSMWCFALSQLKHFKALFNKPLTENKGKLLRVFGVILLIAVQPILWMQSQVALSYVIWLCWVSVWIVLTGLMLSYFAKR